MLPDIDAVSMNYIYSKASEVEVAAYIFSADRNGRTISPEPEVHG